MPTIRSSGPGGHFEALVNAEGQLSVAAVTEPVERHLNAHTGKVWSLPFKEIDATANDDYIFYLKNTGVTDLFIPHIRLSSDTTATEVEINAVTGVAGGSLTTVTPVSRTVGSSATLDATAQTSPDITGLTKAGTLFYMELAVVDTQYHLQITSNIRIPRGQAIAILVETATGIITGTVTVMEGEVI